MTSYIHIRRYKIFLCRLLKGEDKIETYHLNGGGKLYKTLASSAPEAVSKVHFACDSHVNILPEWAVFQFLDDGCTFEEI